MFTTLHTRAPALVLAALLGGAALAVPTPARAQGIAPERALLNRVSGPAGSGVVVIQLRAAPVPDDQDVVDGERALLNRSRGNEYPSVDPFTGDEPADLDGPDIARVRALLNRASL